MVGEDIIPTFADPTMSAITIDGRMVEVITIIIIITTTTITTTTTTITTTTTTAITITTKPESYRLLIHTASERSTLQR